MKALRSPSTSGSDTVHATWRVAALLPLILLVTGLLAAAEESKAAEVKVPEAKLAVWKVKEVNFAYRSTIAVYSCSALRDRVSSIFRAIGARDDLDVSVSNCDTSVIPMEDPRDAWPQEDSKGAWRTRTDGVFNQPNNLLNQRNDRGQLAHVRVRLLMPTEVTPEVLTELERDKSRRELVSRMTGDPSARLDNPLVFPAKWQSVTLSRASVGLEPEECELLDQISTGALRELGVRVVRRTRACDHNRISRIPPQLTVEALMGIPWTSNLPQLPAAGASDPEPGKAPASEAQPPESPTTTPPQ